MPTKTSTSWKAWERYLAGLFEGRRRGAETSSFVGTGQTDVVHPFFGIEAKLLTQPHYGLILDACRQAERASEAEDLLPTAIIKRKGDRKKDALVCFRLEVFIEWFGNPMNEGMDHKFGTVGDDE